MAITKELQHAAASDPRSIRELATAAGMDHSALSRFIRGERGITIDAADRLAAAVGWELMPASMSRAVDTAKRALRSSRHSPHSASVRNGIEAAIEAINDANGQRKGQPRGKATS